MFAITQRQMRLKDLVVRYPSMCCSSSLPDLLRVRIDIPAFNLDSRPSRSGTSEVAQTPSTSIPPVPEDAPAPPAPISRKSSGASEPPPMSSRRTSFTTPPVPGRTGLASGSSSRSTSFLSGDRGEVRGLQGQHGERGEVEEDEMDEECTSD